MVRVGCYIDGFNLYHAVAALAEPQLKWLDLSLLARSLINVSDDQLLHTRYFTALSTWSKEKRARHLQFISAMDAKDVETRLSDFKRVDKHCMSSGKYCKFFEEKQTDVAIASSMIDDAYQNLIDKMILVTADSDQIPTLRLLKARFPQIHLTVAAPPERKSVARDLMNYADDRVELSPGRLRACILPRNVYDKKGKLVAIAPADYV